ncbi:hypothetical protein ACWD0A_07815 [Streptomyces sp. NPDC002867]
MNGAAFCTFTYLAPLVTDVAGLDAVWVPAVLALFGIGSFAGVTVAGRPAATRPRLVLVPGGAALLAGWAVLALGGACATAACNVGAALGPSLGGPRSGPASATAHPCG